MQKISDFANAHDFARQFLPSKFWSGIEVDIQLLATPIQETDLATRKQKSGPAVSIFQFEKIGIKDVLINDKTKDYAALVCKRFGIAPDVNRVYECMALESFDALSFVFARLNYWKAPIQMPIVGDIASAWKMYQNTWRPGKPHPERWPESYWRAYSYFYDR